MENNIKFEEIEFDDVVTDNDEDAHRWSQVCVGHSDFIEEHCPDIGIIQDGGGGICGVKDCQFGADFYIDF